MPYPTMDEIVARLEFELEPKLEAAAEGHLQDMIIEAQVLGKRWTPAGMPPIVAKCIRAAMIRWLRRPEGYVQSRAGDETLQWGEGDSEAAGAPVFTRAEIDLIQGATLAGRPADGFSIATTTPHGPTRWRPGSEVEYLTGTGLVRPDLPTTLPGEVSWP